MNSWSWLLGLAVWLAVSARAQVEVELLMDKDQFLPRESLLVGVRITNMSGQSLLLGRDEGWLRFDLESIQQMPLRKLGQLPVAGEFKIESSQVATKVVDLAPGYLLTQPGRYRLSATVYIKEWDQTLSSKPRSFEVIKGTKLWEQQFGMPQVNRTTNQPPEVRKYSLVSAYAMNRLQLYVNLTDATENQFYQVLPLGPVVSFGEPEAFIDRHSQLHALFQTGARSFQYVVVRSSGQITVRQTHEYLGSRPRLLPDGKGGYWVLGGVRRPTAEDLSPPQTAAPVTNAPGK